jgi:hypothetical protein
MTERFLGRIEQLNSTLKAFVTLDTNGPFEPVTRVRRGGALQ